MRRITTKDGAPDSFKNWLLDNEEVINEKVLNDEVTGEEIWAFFKSNPKIYDDLKTVLVEDQGFICCYCGRRIEDNHHTSIEHLKPKVVHKHETLSFDNLLASCSGGSQDRIYVVQEDENLEDIAIKFGVNVDHLEDVYVNINEEALFRKKYDIENLSEGDRIVIIPKADSNEQHCDTKKGKKELDIHPLQDDCDVHFGFDILNGKIRITNENSSTVEILGLNANRYINQLRKKVVEDSIILKENLIRDFGHSQAEFERNRLTIINNLNDITRSNGTLKPFVFVIIWSLSN